MKSRWFIFPFVTEKNEIFKKKFYELFLSLHLAVGIHLITHEVIEVFEVIRLNSTYHVVFEPDKVGHEVLTMVTRPRIVRLYLGKQKRFFGTHH